MSEPHAHRGAVALVTIVAEAIVEQRLVRDLHDSGAHGWTVTAARGEGPRNRRVGALEGGKDRQLLDQDARLIATATRYLADPDGQWWLDRSSRPRTSPRQTPAKVEARIVTLRKTRKLGPAMAAG